MAERQLTTLTTMKMVGVAVGLVVVTGLWCWGWPYWCPICPNCSACRDCAACADVEKCCADCPEGESAAASIVVDDPLAAVWMAMDDKWVGNDAGDPDHWVCQTSTGDQERFGDCKTKPDNGGYEDTYLRPGVLFQTGPVTPEAPDDPDDPEAPDDPDDPDENFLDSVLITTKTDGVLDEKTVDKENFDWLDINTVGTKCPLDPLHAYALFANSLVITECDGAAAIKQSDGTTLHRTCLRERSLHAGLQPATHVITYWPDSNSLYAVDVDRKLYVEDGESTEILLTETIVKLAEPVTVDRWKDGCWQQRYKDVVQVRLVFTDDGSAQHGGFHEPAMNGTRTPFPERPSL